MTEMGEINKGQWIKQQQRGEKTWIREKQYKERTRET